MSHDAAPELAPVPVAEEPPTPLIRQRALEAMLFASAGPVKLAELVEATGWDKPLVERDLQHLEESLHDRGIELQRVAGALRLVTVPAMSRWVERLIGVQTRRRLSRAQLEVLACVAYKQPVTRAQVEAMRGVGSDRILGQLVDLRLARELGRAELPGRPLLYGTTSDFLRYFGIDALTDLPDVSTLKTRAAVSASQAQFNAAARGEDVPDEEESVVDTEETEVRHNFGTMQPLAAELSQEPSGGLRKLLDKIRGKAAK